MEVLGEPPDRTDVGKCGSLRVITALEFLEHPFAKLGHRDLLVTQTYLLAASDASPCHHAQRPPRERLSSNGVSGKCLGRNVDRKSTRLNSSHLVISYAVFCLKKKS